jgi:hypothetical protein
MNKQLKTIAIACLLGITGIACSDWLDVDSTVNVKESALFSDIEGCHSAVNGVYRLLAAPELYGQQLSWGLASVIGNNYDRTKLPGHDGNNNYVNYLDLADGKYTTIPSTNLIDPVWARGYRVIANCNNLLARVGEKDSTFFPGGAAEQNMILGEMLGLRAMMHLDLLRLFAPSTAADDEKPYMPYVTRFPERQPEHLTVAANLAAIIADLEKAKALLAGPDTLVNAAALASWEARLKPGDNITAKTFHGTRGTRFNYFAAAAILARAYQWRGDAGDLEKAYRAAAAVYRFYSARRWFSFTPKTEMNAGENMIPRKMPHDILFALYNNNMYDIIENAVTQIGTSFAVQNDAHLFTGDEQDYRAANLIAPDKTSRRWTAPGTGGDDIARYQGPLIPVARLSEMIYIMCDHLAATDLPAAIALLEDVRVARGSNRPLDVTITEADFREILHLEMTREFLTEGQTFFLYKRLDQPIYNGSTAQDMTDRYVLPRPHGEMSYINLL